MASPSNAEIYRQIEKLRRDASDAKSEAMFAKQIAAENKNDLAPILSTFNAGKILGKVLFYLGGVLGGLAAMYGVLSAWFQK